MTKELWITIRNNEKRDAMKSYHLLKIKIGHMEASFALWEAIKGTILEN